MIRELDERYPLFWPNVWGGVYVRSPLFSEQEGKEIADSVDW